MDLKSPLNWYGGKYYMRKEIVKYFPDHSVYVEGFGGAGHILLHKNPSLVEVYNDINEGLYSFFKILRDDKKRDILIEKLTLTPYSREEFFYCRNNYDKEEDEIEKARMFYVKTMQSFSGVGQSWSYTKTKSGARRGMSGAVSSFLRNIDENLPDVVERLRQVQIENLDIIELLNKYDTEDTLFYLDPPYVAKTRVADDVYDKEMPIEKHQELVDKILILKGKVIMSGYDNEVYDKLVQHGWRKVLLGEYVNRNGEKEKKKTKTKEEYLWMNFESEN